MKKIVFATLILASAPAFGMMKLSKFNRFSLAQKRFMSDSQSNKFKSLQSNELNSEELLAQKLLSRKLENARHIVEISRYLDETESFHRSRAENAMKRKCFSLLHNLIESLPEEK